MSVGASPRTGTLNSRDLQRSQLMNTSIGSQVISPSPPAPVMLSSLATSPASYQQQQQRHTAAHPAPPPHFQSPLQSTSSSPRQLSPQPISPVSLSLMSPAVPVVTVNAASSDVQNHRVTSHSPAAGVNTHTYGRKQNVRCEKVVSYKAWGSAQLPRDRTSGLSAVARKQNREVARRQNC